MIGKKRFLIGSAAAAGVLIAGTISAHAALIDFSGGGGDLGVTFADFTDGLITVRANGFEVEKSDTNFTTYTPANLFQRDDDPADHGIGVCNSGDGDCGNGDQNEIDNNGDLIDIIRLDVAGLDLLTLRLSSLDGLVDNIDRLQAVSTAGRPIDNRQLESLQAELIDISVMHTKLGGDVQDPTLIQLRSMIDSISMSARMNRR